MTASKRRAGVRRGRFGLLGAVAATADAALNLPAPLGTTDILDPPNVATMTGTIDTVTGDLNVPAANFDFPTFTGSAGGFPVAVSFAAVDDITGAADTSGNVLTDASTFHTTVVIAPGPSPLDTCGYDSDESFSTGTGSPFNGDPFTVNLGNPITITNGIVQTGWGATHFTQTSGGSICSGTLTPAINGGAGGLEMGNGIDLTPSSGGTTTPPPATTPKKKKKCKKAKKKKSADSAKKKKCKKKKKK